ncbi:restriction endonuclease subunit S [Corynebacterium sanguinis]|uniref:restriction endonuclease subunit S n=1 Tax=Corynebacterium sanguinis TaxID=2594913 RepID=UPI0021A5CA1F|nr:restriction endonuclease subunit S [Corynebacterium sanguinis]MCT1412225.1 restriction endonuclease subunit S [Corynebacterium sanguinis]MCT2251611.1 restriction endonuclease subunit S [Corynebacterium sanguinis]
MTSTTSTSSATKWIGEVPSGWRVLEPRRVFSLRREPERPGDIHLTPSQKYGVLPQEEYVAITGSQVVRNLSGTTMQHVEAGDFISHLRTFQGGLELAKQTGKVSPAYTVVTPGPEAFPNYYKYVLKSRGYISQIASVTDQLRDGQSMRFPEFNETWLPVPPFEEQKLIADYLDRETAEIDAFITELGELSALTTERLRSEAAELLTPPSQIGSGWINAHLGPLVSIATGQVDPQKDPYRGMPLIAPNHIESRTSRLLGLETAEEQGADSGKYLAREGQVLFSKIRPTLMKSTLAPVDCLTSADMYPIDANSRFLTNAFLLEYLLGPQFEGFAARESARVAMPKLNRETLSAAPISLPPLEYQHRMVKKMQKARLHAREHLAEVETAVRLGQERRAALISAAVTGQIDVSAQGVSVAEQLRDELEVHV